MCKCGCNTCETKGPLLTEGKVKSLLSEGLQYHIDKKIPLFETVYRIGSDKHLALIKEARKMYSRNVIDLCEDDEALIGTHLGEFGLYEDVSVPLDLPMLEESKMPTQGQVDKFFALTQNEMHYLNSKPVAGQEKTFNNTEIEPWDEYDLSNFNSLVRKAKSKGQLKENEDKLLKIKQELEALRPGTISWIDDIKISSYDGSLQVELDYTLYPDEIKQLAQIATKYGMELKYMTGKNATLVKRIDEAVKNALTEKKAKKISDDKLIKLIPKLPKGYVSKNTGIGKYTISTPDGGDIVLTQSKDKKNWSYEPSNIALKILNEEVNNRDLDNAIYRLENVLKYLDIEYKETRRGEKYVQINYIPVTKPQSQNPEFVNVRYNNDEDLEIIKNRLGLYILNENKAKKKKKDPPLNKPKRGGSKAYYVYVRDPKTKKIKKVSFGSGGLRAKIKNKEARNAFAARHNCKNKKDRTKAGYWSCNLPRYAEALGLGAKMNTFW